MIDLTNKSETDGNIQKFANILEIYQKYNRSDISTLANIFDISIKYVNENHISLSTNWKIWTIFVVIQMYFSNKINVESDINNIVNDFVNYQKIKYINYSNNYSIIASEYDLDRDFVYAYIKKFIKV